NVSASKKNLALVIDFPADFPSAIITDPGKIRRILINLVGNAIKFTETGSIVVKLFISQKRNKNMLQCDVSDTGRGIPESDIPRLFSPFSQATNRRETDEGTGLGLAICRQSIEALGGSINVKSTVGEGSTFSFSLPITLAEEQPKSPASAESDEIVGVETDGASIRILIVDDNAANRALLAGILQKSEIKYDIAKNGKEALDLCDSFSPNLIFMDIRMPGMDGKEAAARIKSRMEEKAPKLIALTAHAMEDEKAAILAAGFDGFIRKPYLEQEIWLSSSQNLGLRLRSRRQCAAPVKISKEKTIAGIRSLPIDILSELRNCIEMLDKDACRSVIQKICATEPVLAADLRSMVDSLEYVELLPFLDECLEKNGVGR
ncbi:MAG: ATP-binding protein, partial [Spirochaetia bacterium]|nr:ATP-binding protein [Spirochaetia bacterium]